MNKKPKIIIDEPQVSSEEIKGRQDFEGLVQQVPAGLKPWYKSPWVMASAAAVVIAVSTISLWPGGNDDNLTNDENQNRIEAVEENQLATLEKKTIKPPVPELDIPFNKYQTNGNKETVIEHFTGSEITIPAHAFIDREGNEVKGDIRIEYREFHDVVDQVLCGIPMTYEHEGSEHQFESAGMMQIFAYQGDQRVFLDPEKPINVKMRSNYKGDHYNLYEFDTAAGEWLDIGKDQVVIESGSDPEPAQDYADNVKDVEQMTVAQVVPQESKRVDVAKDELAVIKKDISSMEKTKPVSPKKANPKRYSFDIDIDPKEFPELKNFTKVLFEVDPKSRFEANYYETQWTDIELSSKENGLYEMTLWRGKTKKSFEVYPVFDEKNFASAKRQFENDMKQYKTDLAQRRTDEKNKQKELKDLIERMEDAYAARMAAIKKQQEQVRTIFASQDKVYRVFQAKNFGTFNCDSPQKWPKGCTIFAKYDVPGSDSLYFNQLVLVERGRNMYFTLTGMKRMRYDVNPSENNVVWGITKDGDLAYTSDVDFSGLRKGRDHKKQFNLNIVKKDELTALKIKEVLNI